MKHLIATLLMLCSIFSFQHELSASIKIGQRTELNTWIDSSFTEKIKSLNIAGASVVVIQGDSILHLNGYGITDIESKNAVDAHTSIFGVGSVSKTFVGTAAMKLCEDGKLDLDRDVNNYLKSIQLKYPFNDSITARHLLTHTAGFDDNNIGTIVHSEDKLIPLAQYIKGHMSPQLRPSGKAIAYSNNGYALMGLVIEEVSGMPFHEYVKENILNPLDMNYSGFRRQAELEENYVASYWKNGGNLIPYKTGFHHFYPASSFRSTAADMGNYMSMWLNNGYFNGTQLLDSSTVSKMFQSAFKNYDKANFGWLLGFTESQWYDLRIIEHTGGIQGFRSLLRLVPERNLGVFICVNSSNARQNNSRKLMNQFTYDLFARLMSDCMVQKETASITSTVGTVDEPLEMFTGAYRYIRYAHSTLDKIGVLLGLAPEIEIVSNNSTLEIVEWQEKLTPISGLSFHSNYNRHQAFGKNTKGDISNFYIDSYAYEKLKWYEPLKFQRVWIGSIFLILLIYIITSGIRKLFVRNRERHLLKKINFSLASLIILFIVVFAYTLFTTDPMQFFNDVPLLMKFALVLPFVIIPLGFVSVYLLIRAFKNKEFKILSLIYQSLIIVAATLFIPWLMYYNLIGFNY
ncbi:serine hydrolase [Carboxylicivirga sp. M1479]|uniref:serine hydrolase domain-containing protein n=1 Tax=Carboxylicivirga sp. M1479 TaxID=2594476 RepID=UPI0011786321|nr:serine hydrolase domain-containing protein [Carboxylicivirga sp. M1479]TRX63175.1 beta-lactamase family protein [Carboxylicivirga sp. M1479]